VESKKVPLVIYRNGVREVIGEAEVTEDEQGFQVKGVIHNADVALEIRPNVGEFSVGPFGQDLMGDPLPIEAAIPHMVRHFRENVPIRLRECVSCTNGECEQAVYNQICPCCFNNHVFGK
jgi:hypothetical protein